MKNTITVLFVVVFSFLTFAPAQAVVKYTVTDLGTLGGQQIRASGINANGQVVGYAKTTDNVWHAFLYSVSTMIDLGTFGGTQSEAYDINDSGQVAGWSSTSGDASGHAFLRHAGPRHIRRNVQQ
jgi:probable HAF family extracellular repeat protein